MFNACDEKMMQLALQLAEKGVGNTWPNPLVGAVLAKQYLVIGSGWHKQYGGPHAEVFALQHAGLNAKGSTLYVNLEPCSHYGKTPPCAQAIIAAGIKRVVCAMRDPNPKVFGKGFRDLRKAGIKVEVGLLSNAAFELNKVFIKRIMTGLPYVISKMAQSLDGKIALANGESKWISGLLARRYVHQLRNHVDAVLVGAGTVIQDDPSLNVRMVRQLDSKKPIRFVLTGRRKIASDIKLILTGNKTKTVLVKSFPIKNLEIKQEKGYEVWKLPGKSARVDCKLLLEIMSERNIYCLLIEGGAEINAAFMGLDGSGRENLVDEIQWFFSPKIIGGKTALGTVGGMGIPDMNHALAVNSMQWEEIGNDWLLKARLKTASLRKGL